MGMTSELRGDASGGQAMASGVGEQMILDALKRVPEGRWGEVLDYLQSLSPVEAAEGRVLTAADLLGSGLVGLWADRADLGESREFARRLRQRAQTRVHGG